jgi:hypothetical protein
VSTHSDIGDDLEITKIGRRRQCGGTWICGTIAGYRFSALVFPEHADDSNWEIGRSRISKLWLAKTSNKETVYNWDRGLDFPAASDKAQAVVDFLCEGLADYVYPTQHDKE